MSGKKLARKTLLGAVGVYCLTKLFISQQDSKAAKLKSV